LHFAGEHTKYDPILHSRVIFVLIIHTLFVIGCLVPAGLSLRPSWSIDFGDVSETNGWEYGPKMMRRRQNIQRPRNRVVHIMPA